MSGRYYVDSLSGMGGTFGVCRWREATIAQGIEPRRREPPGQAHRAVPRAAGTGCDHGSPPPPRRTPRRRIRKIQRPPPPSPCGEESAYPPGARRGGHRAPVQPHRRLPRASSPSPPQNYRGRSLVSYCAWS